VYTAHFAAALAVKARAPQVPAWALLTAAFIPDFAWIVLAVLGVEPTQPPLGFFDDWSHSLLMIVVWASLFAALFWSKGKHVMLPVWVAGLTHIPLDFLIHPARLALYPHSSVHLGWNLWAWGQERGWLGANKYWWVEMTAVVLLTAIYIQGANKQKFALHLIAATCVALAALHLMALL
jgi:hypothetical protein